MQAPAGPTVLLFASETQCNLLPSMCALGLQQGMHACALYAHLEVIRPKIFQTDQAYRLLIARAFASEMPAVGAQQLAEDAVCVVLRWCDGDGICRYLFA